MYKMRWGGKRKRQEIEEEDEPPKLGLPPLSFFMDSDSNSTIYSNNNNVYFNDDVTEASCFALNRELRMVEQRVQLLKTYLNTNDDVPIYLHITTNGGSIHAAFSVIDCINSLACPVYTVVDGFVASAGTLISLAGKKKFIQPNAYILIHQLRSGMWGKMAEIEDEYHNLKKLSEHITSYYEKNTKIKRKQLCNMLTKEISWDAEEAVGLGLVDDIYKKD